MFNSSSLKQRPHGSKSTFEVPALLLNILVCTFYILKSIRILYPRLLPGRVSMTKTWQRQGFTSHAKNVRDCNNITSWDKRLKEGGGYVFFFSFFLPRQQIFYL